ncbi:nucleotidyltransferase domain-containing protein [Streptomyces sp. NPDC051563]|uniref:nucleotidyltransferase domain-containing protein n=1 Tax=Streptomyces sp. NPDC051563 TaxID=3365659 RepID=UPI003796AE7F
MDADPADPADLVEQARRIARARFPDALAVILAGSSAAGRARSTSDLDIAVLVEDGGETYRETLRFEGRLVELFVHTRAGLAELFAADVTTRRAVLPLMYASGVVLVDRDGEAGRARASAEAVLRLGPPVWDADAVESRRYGLTDALDDLGDAEDPVERVAVAGVVLAGAAELLFDHRRAWSGGGKWLPRRLEEADPRLGKALLDGHLHVCATGDPAGLAAAASEVLDLVGGPLREGYRRTWPGAVDPVATAPGHRAG